MAGQMTLHWSPRSPYVRKVMIAAHEMGLQDRIRIVRTIAGGTTPHRELMKLNPEVLKATKIAVKNVRVVPHEQAADYLQAKSQEMRFQDKEGGRSQGLSQFLDEKSYRPGYGPYARPQPAKA